jgi:hypothetical protein
MYAFGGIVLANALKDTKSAYARQGLAPNEVQTVVTYKTLFTLLEGAQPPRVLERNELRGFFWNLFTPGVDSQRELFAEARSDGIESPPDQTGVSAAATQFALEGIEATLPLEVEPTTEGCGSGFAPDDGAACTVVGECTAPNAETSDEHGEDAALNFAPAEDVEPVVVESAETDVYYETELDGGDGQSVAIFGTVVEGDGDEPEEPARIVLLSETMPNDTPAVPNRVPLFAFVARAYEPHSGVPGAMMALAPTRADLVRAVRLSAAGIRAFVIAKPNGIFILSATSAFALFQIFVRASLAAEEKEIARCSSGVRPGEPARRFAALIGEGLDDIYSKIESHILTKQGTFVYGDVASVAHSHRTEIAFCKIVNLISARDVISAAGRRDNYARHYFARAGLAFDRAVYNTDVGATECPRTFDMPVVRASFFTWRQARANGGIWV